jgi:UDP-3-O-[3-hydroxymyristoyl] N-acetylglucosamine deacetylase
LSEQRLSGSHLDVPETTLQGDVTLAGLGLFSGAACLIRLHPAADRTGIVLRAGDATIPCTADHITRDASHTTTLGAPGVRIRCVEHLLASLYFCGVTNCVIEVLTGTEIPGDGSGACAEYISAILAAGLEKQDSAMLSLAVTAPQRFSWNGSAATIGPSAEAAADQPGSLRVRVGIAFPPPVGRQQAEWRSRAGKSPRGHARHAEFSSARTFLRDDLADQVADGRDYWTYLHDSIRGLPDSRAGLRLMAFENGEWLAPPRHASEAAWHKLVDLVGDLSLLGGRLVGDVRVDRPGHAYNHRLVRWLSGSYREDMPVTARLD